MKKIAEKLLEIGAVKINFDHPFTLVSRKKSFIYIDCRLPISFVSVRRLITDAFIEVLKEKNFDIVAGGESAGIPYASFISYAMNKPMVYVRKKPKGYGLNAQIEGSGKKGEKAILIEDLITNGQSKLNFINALRKAEIKIDECAVVFDREQGGKEVLGKEGVGLFSLTNISETLEVATEKKIINKEQKEKIEQSLRQ